MGVFLPILEVPRNYCKGITSVFGGSTLSWGGVINQLNQAGIGEHMYCILCGQMTPDQKQIVCKRLKVDTQLFIDVLT